MPPQLPESLVCARSGVSTSAFHFRSAVVDDRVDPHPSIPPRPTPPPLENRNADAIDVKEFFFF